MPRSEIRGYAKHCRKLLDRAANPAAAWESLRRLLGALQLNAATTIRDRKSGALISDSPAVTAQIILAVLNGATDRDEVILHMVALGYIASEKRQRFASDDSFFATAARRFRAFGRTQYIGHTSMVTAERRFAMKDIRAKHTRHLGELLMTTFAPAGALLQEREQDHSRGAVERRNEVFRAITGDATI